MGSKTVFIYGLFDPIDAKVRYVEKTNSPQKRLRSHINSGPQEFTPKEKMKKNGS